MVMKLTKEEGEGKTVEMRDMKSGDIAFIVKYNRYVIRIGNSLSSIWFILGDCSTCDYYDYLSSQYHKVRILTQDEILTVEFRGTA